MSFLSIAFLAALPLAAAPVLLHLFDRRRHVAIDWGAMQFLLEAATRKTSARRLKQWLLLLLRVGAVAALVLALARPMAPGSFFGGAERGETILVLDNSMSTLRAADDGNVFAAAIDRGLETLDDVERGDFVRVLLSSPYPVWATTGAVRMSGPSRRVVADRLRELRPTHGKSDLLSALFAAVQADRQPTGQRRRIVLLTDGQGADWRLGDEDGWRRFRETLESSPIPTQLDIVELPSATANAANLVVEDIRSSRAVVGRNQPFTLSAQVRNRGRATSAACSLAWSVGQTQLQEGAVDRLEVGAGHDVLCKHSFANPGVYSISCSIDADDCLTADNTATLIVEVVDEVPVTLVEGAGELAEVQRDSFFVKAALGSDDEAPPEARGIYTPTTIDPERLASFDLARQRAVVVSNFTSLDEEAIGRLREFVQSGGGLWIALGPRTDIDAFNHLLFADSNGLAPLAIDEIVDESAPVLGSDVSESQAPAIDSPPKDHPATAELADRQRLDLEGVAVSQRVRFRRPPENEQVSTLLSLTNGEPLAVEKFYGQGRVIVLGVPLRLTWSELARSQAFVVMVRNWLDYLAAPRATRYNLSPGEPIALRLAGGQGQAATLRTPHGDEIELTAQTLGDEIAFRSSRTILPGDYHLELGLSGDSVPFHVSRDSVESDLSPLAADDRRRLSDLAGIGAAPSATLAAAQREPLWPTLLLLLIGLIAAELLLSGAMARERFGAERISETGDAQAAAGSLIGTTTSKHATEATGESPRSRETSTV